MTERSLTPPSLTCPGSTATGLTARSMTTERPRTRGGPAAIREPPNNRVRARTQSADATLDQYGANGPLPATCAGASSS
jgi:hypothetical protein